MASTLEINLESISRMDCLHVLDKHLARARVSLGLLRASAEGETFRHAALELQSRLDSYYHFLAGAGPEMPQLIARLGAFRREYAGMPSAVSAANHVEEELRLSCASLQEEVADVEGPALLSWLHTLRYYVSRCWWSLDDLEARARAASRLPELRALSDSLAGQLSEGWSELTSQAAALLRRLETLLAGPWWRGSGRKAWVILEKLEALLGWLGGLRVEAAGLRAKVSALVEEASHGHDPAAKRVAREFREMKSLSPRLKYLGREAENALRRVRFEIFLLRAGGGRARGACSMSGRVAASDWAAPLAKSLEAVAAVQPLADAVLRVTPSVAPLIQSLRDEETRQELLTRRESLSEAMLESGLVHGAETFAALASLNWLAERLGPAPGVKQFCTRFGDAVFPDDPVVRCPQCLTLCHLDCLRGGKCPVDGQQIIPA